VNQRQERIKAINEIKKQNGELGRNYMKWRNTVQIPNVWSYAHNRYIIIIIIIIMRSEIWEDSTVRHAVDITDAIWSRIHVEDCTGHFSVPAVLNKA
jgi:hypothetical protein